MKKYAVEKDGVIIRVVVAENPSDIPLAMGENLHETKTRARRGEKYKPSLWQRYKKLLIGALIGASACGAAELVYWKFW